MSYTPQIQYTEGDSDATPTGNVAMWWDVGNGNLVRPTSLEFPFPVGGDTLTNINDHLNVIEDSTTAVFNTLWSEDDPFASGSTIVMTGVVRNDTPSNSSDTNGDVETFQISNGRLWVSESYRPDNTLLNTYAVRLTTNTTTTPTSTTSYISSIVITTEVAGTTSTVTIRDKQGTPQVLVNGLTTVAASLTPTVINFQTPVKMDSGIDIITAGAAAATVDVWINYYQ